MRHQCVTSVSSAVGGSPQLWSAPDTSTYSIRITKQATKTTMNEMKTDKNKNKKQTNRYHI